ncbi:peptidase [Mycena galericulata]|nr:peptidase [Mycena galericulata]
MRTMVSLVAFATLAIAWQSGQIPLSNNQVENPHGVAGTTNLDLAPDVLRLVEVSVDDGTNAFEPVWMTEAQKFEAKANGIHFMDITETPLLGASEKQRFSYPSPNSTIVATVFPHLSTSEPKANLENFTSYHNRYYDSDSGKASAEWLYAKILTYTAELGSDEQKALIDIEAVKHPWKQNSIIIRINPPTALDSDPITILGAHIDSINHAGITMPAPGAGDDGSGTVTILEAYRALLLTNYIPVSPLEFHFYAGEEGGLLGSQAIASRYESAGKSVKGMIQFDMTAWHAAGTREEIAVMTNYVDPSLTEFQILLIERYLDIPWVKDQYPARASSDHASWTKAGYQACHPLEARFKNANPNVHTVNDRIDISSQFSFDHMLHFSKLAVAFAIELSSY